MRGSDVAAAQPAQEDLQAAPLPTTDLHALLAYLQRIDSITDVQEKAKAVRILQEALKVMQPPQSHQIRAPVTAHPKAVSAKPVKSRK